MFTAEEKKILLKCLLKVSLFQRHLGSNQERKITFLAFLAFLQLVILSFLLYFIKELLFSGCVSANAKLLAEGNFTNRSKPLLPRSDGCTNVIGRSHSKGGAECSAFFQLVLF